MRQSMRGSVGTTSLQHPLRRHYTILRHNTMYVCVSLLCASHDESQKLRNLTLAMHALIGSNNER
jgi:hypothetical protein